MMKYTLEKLKLAPCCQSLKNPVCFFFKVFYEAVCLKSILTYFLKIAFSSCLKAINDGIFEVFFSQLFASLKLLLTDSFHLSSLY